MATNTKTDAVKDAIKTRAATNPEPVYHAAGYSGELKKQNGNLAGRCPFHDDRNPSFKISTTGDHAGDWYCFGACDRGGDIFHFYMERNSCDFPTAKDELADALGIRRPRKRSEKPWDVEDYAEYVELPERFLRQIGVGPYGGGGVLIRHKDTTGGVLHSFIRKSKSQRWWGGDGAGSCLYGLDRLTADEPVIVVEGQSDCQVLWYNDLNALGTPGQNYKPEWIEHLADFPAVYVVREDPKARLPENVLLAFNEAGEQPPEIRVVNIPAGDVLDLWKAVENERDDFSEKLQRALGRAKPLSPDAADTDDELKQAERLVRIVENNATEFLTSDTDTAYIRLPVDAHTETWPVQGAQFRRWMSHEFRRREGKPPGGQGLSDARDTVDAICHFEGGKHELHNRFAWHDGTLYVDLADDQWRTVQISADGWRVCSEAPVYFRRYAHMQPQVEPKPGGKLEDIFSLLNAPEDHDLRLLLQVYLVASYLPHIPRPVLIVAGPQGSAKSSFMRTLRNLTDPSATPVLSFPRDEKELVQALQHNAVAYFDNVTSLPVWLSDLLCRASTGEGFSKRQLYSDDADVIYSYRRAVGFNGVTNPANRPDLLDRSIIVNLQRIPEAYRVTEEELQHGFTALRPQLLGAICSALVGAIDAYPNVNIDTLPRMADFAKWGAAISESLGYGADAFVDAYSKHVEELNELAIQNQPFAEAILRLLEEHGDWQGTASQLLEATAQIAAADGIDTDCKEWPGSYSWVGRRLKEASANLQAEGVEIIETRNGRDRIIGLRCGDSMVTA